MAANTCGAGCHCRASRFALQRSKFGTSVVSGRVERGVIHAGDGLEIVGLGSADEQVVVTGIQPFHKDVAQARAGMNVLVRRQGPSLPAPRWRAATQPALAACALAPMPASFAPAEGAHDSARMTETPLMSSLFILTID